MTTDPKRPDPVALADAEARNLAHALLALGHAALAWTDPETATPGISRIAFANDPLAGPLTLISGLAPHYRALQANPTCALMVGEAGDKGDPMTHPRLMLRAMAEFVAASDPDVPGLRERWLGRNPKARVYIDLPDFSFVRLQVQSALLNGGFARAFRLAPQDLRP